MGKLVLQRGTLWNEIEKLKDKGNFLTEEQILRLLLGICRGLEAIHAKGYAHRSVGGSRVLAGQKGRASSREMRGLCTPPKGQPSRLFCPPRSPASLSRAAHRSFPLPCRDLKPTNILLGDEGQPVLMDLGSMNQACIHVEGSRQALALQVRVSRFLCPPVPQTAMPQFGHMTMTCAPPFELWGHCSRTGQPSGAPSPTEPRSSFLCRATVSSTSGLMSGGGACGWEFGVGRGAALYLLWS